MQLTALLGLAAQPQQAHPLLYQEEAGVQLINQAAGAEAEVQAQEEELRR
ncbi:hypothetical protein BR63_05615 [Thermanaerosceptrum fracticalcis]|uniref:Uncharacterized protein n=1 Tax=Thermanaerosceptrum fracticalcis TaxID=1712410 RepID=A0A7G6E182_THEFR|nr:hypothetical protein [Thermanaerosceptrum fracticalcis]QNB45836.1 hypothetical protein BR63_05615 [Thermanaerosceptrum fracticalcis]